ncbi:MAG TPA: cell division protein FtsZ [Anaerolineaceae bacterium]|nr:cell division protein FtsZ [Anaerolineaceae bacterium]HNS36450.1 cell division protein FtsZ [Anaerolineaceae bacterium]
MNFTIATRSFVPSTPLPAHKPCLKVLGLGGGGSNAINRMIELGLTGVDFIAANTDAQALNNSLAPVRLQLGPERTRGLGAGGNPQVGEEAAEESYDLITEALKGADMVFLAAGMGGGTGTGSIPVAARAAKAIGAVTVGVVTMPFSFEMGKRQTNARGGLAKLRGFTDTLIAIPNDRLLDLGKRDLTLDMALRLADDVLRQGVQGITELITETGLINVDFAHIRQMLQLGGGSIMSIGQGEGANKASQAIERALHHPLLDAICLENATAILANFTAGPDITFMEVMEALNQLQERTGNSAEIIPGITTDPRMKNRAQVILIVTGLGATPVQVIPAEPRAVETRPVEMPAQPASPVGRPPLTLHPEMDTVAAANDLDLPAFMRRRTRTMVN